MLSTARFDEMTKATREAISAHRRRKPNFKLLLKNLIYLIHKFITLPRPLSTLLLNFKQNDLNYLNLGTFQEMKIIEIAYIMVTSVINMKLNNNILTVMVMT